MGDLVDTFLFFVSNWEIIYVKGSFIQTFGPTLALLFEGFINCFSMKLQNVLSKSPSKKLFLLLDQLFITV
jgi:hypothetical protein